MMRSRFEEQLAQLHRELIEMGALCERLSLIHISEPTRH